MLPHSLLLLLSFSVHETLACPLVVDPSSRAFHLAKFGHKVARFSSQGSGVTVGSIPVFDPQHAKQELQDVLAKYAQASQFLDGIGLAPPLNITFASDYQNDSGIADAQGLYVGARIPSTASGPLLPVNLAANHVMPLTDYISGSLDLLYYGPLEFGSSSQQLTVDFDTGSSDLWIPANCGSCGSQQFNARASSTYKTNRTKLSITYGSGAVSGFLARDTVSMSGLTVSQQYFGAMNSESSDFQSSPNNGLIGMAFSTIAQSRQPTFFENLLIQNNLSLPLFSVHLARNQESGSEVCFGCYDSTKATGSVSWSPVISKTYWTIGMTSMSVNSTNSLQTNIYAAIDTGTTLIYVPDAIAQQFYALIPGAQADDDFGPGFYTFPCASQPTISLAFAGTDYLFSGLDFNLGLTGENSTDCVGGILSLGEGFPANLAIIGDEFLKSWYSVFDYSNGARVGFAPSINNQN